MAAPSLGLNTIFIARVKMSSPNSTTDRQQIDEMHQQVTLEFAKEIREKITSVRNKYRGTILKECLHFEGLQIVRADKLDSIRQMVEQADAELKAIDQNLGAALRLIPLSVDHQARGELYEAVVGAIRGQVYRVLMERLEGLAGKQDVPKRSRLALLELCDRMKAWNVLGDPHIEETINEFRLQFEHGVIAPVADEVRRVVESMTETPAAYLEVA